MTRSREALTVVELIPVFQGQEVSGTDGEQRIEDAVKPIRLGDDLLGRFLDRIFHVVVVHHVVKPVDDVQEHDLAGRGVLQDDGDDLVGEGMWRAMEGLESVVKDDRPLSDKIPQPLVSGDMWEQSGRASPDEGAVRVLHHRQPEDGILHAPSSLVVTRPTVVVDLGRIAGVVRDEKCCIRRQPRRWWGASRRLKLKDVGHLHLATEVRKARVVAVEWAFGRAKDLHRVNCPVAGS